MKRGRFSSDEETLRRLLRDQRIRAGLRQEELARQLGTHQSFVSKYESGERLLTFVETVNICKVLNLDPQMLLMEYLRHHDA